MRRTPKIPALRCEQIVEKVFSASLRGAQGSYGAHCALNGTKPRPKICTPSCRLTSPPSGSRGPRGRRTLSRRPHRRDPGSVRPGLRTVIVFATTSGAPLPNQIGWYDRRSPPGQGTVTSSDKTTLAFLDSKLGHIRRTSGTGV